MTEKFVVKSDSEGLFSVDKTTLEGLRNGSQKAVSKIFKIFEEYVRNCIRCKIYCRDAQEDVFSDVWERIVKGIKNIKTSNVRSYIWKIVRNCINNYYSRSGKSAPVTEFNDKLNIATQLDEADAQAKETLLNARKYLSKTEDYILMLSLEGKVSYKRLAEEMGIPYRKMVAMIIKIKNKLYRRIKGIRF